jgi:chromosomal replication initiation ATPase DnaA
MVIKRHATQSTHGRSGRQADEQMEARYRLTSAGFGLDDIAQRVAEVMDLPLEAVWETSRRRQTVKARSLLCHWASRELGLIMTAIGKRLGLTQPAVSIAASRGKEIAGQQGVFVGGKTIIC